MIYDICEILKSKLVGLSFVDKLAGLTQVAVDVKADASPPVVKRFPVACSVLGKDCSDAENRLSDLMPDSKLRSVIFFEDITGITFFGQERNELIFRCRPRLVGWINQKKLGKNECSVTPLIVANIIKAFGTGRRFNDGLYIKTMINVIGEVAKTPAIFNKYTFSEIQNQYLMYPYDYFALDLSVEFRINADCIDDFVVGPEDECNDT